MTLIEFVKKREGCAHDNHDGTFSAYWDPYGRVWTIGYGSTGPHVVEGLRWTQAQCDADLAVRLESARHQLLLVTHGVVWPEGAQDALTDFVYNEGIGRFEHSALAGYVVEGNWAAVRLHLLDWEYGGGKRLAGLVTRREGEAAMIEAPKLA